MCSILSQLNMPHVPFNINYFTAGMRYGEIRSLAPAGDYTLLQACKPLTRRIRIDIITVDSFLYIILVAM